MKSFLKHFPKGMSPRKEQTRILDKELPQEWDAHDVIIINVPVAGGKSIIAKTISNVLNKERDETVALCTPTVILQDQYVEEFTELPSLKGQARYKCKSGGSCADTADEEERHCVGCPYVKAKQEAEEAPTAVYNLHSYLYADDAKDIAILDEAHNSISSLRELYTFKFWAHIDNYPESMRTHGDVVIWLEHVLEVTSNKISSMKDKAELRLLKRYANKLKLLRDGLKKSPGDFYYQYDKQFYKNVMKDCLVIVPINLKYFFNKLKTANKLILMSATFNSLDARELGLSDKKVLFIEAESEISPRNRPILMLPCYKANYENKKIMLPILAQYLEKLADKHKNKGLIHITYDMIEPLKLLLEHNPRFIWHTKLNKDKQFKEFKKSKDSILMAAGMAEGVDLKGDEFSWQVITKVQFPSLGDGFVKYMQGSNKKWYTWQTVKTIIQQSGRICRTPTDYGITYILDSNFIGLYYGYGKEFFPKYFKDAFLVGQQLIKSDYKDFFIKDVKND